MARKINYIIVHCTATPEGRWVTNEEITRWHRARGFRTIGYHYVVYLDGTVHAGRPENEIGAHCQGRKVSTSPARPRTRGRWRRGRLSRSS